MFVLLGWLEVHRSIGMTSRGCLRVHRLIRIALIARFDDVDVLCAPRHPTVRGPCFPATSPTARGPCFPTTSLAVPGHPPESNSAEATYHDLLAEMNIVAILMIVSTCAVKELGRRDKVGCSHRLDFWRCNGEALQRNGSALANKSSKRTA